MLVYGVREQGSARYARGLPGFVFVVEASQRNTFAIDFDRSRPPMAISVPRNASVVRGRARLAPDVLGILTRSDLAEISSSVIETIAVDVIDSRSVLFGQTKQFSVQAETQKAAVHSDSAYCIAAAVQAPAPLGDEAHVIDINTRIGAYGSVGGIKRNQGAETIFAEDSRRWLPLAYSSLCCVVAGGRAVVTRPDIRRLLPDDLAARQTRTLNRHRDLLISPRGVRPGVALTTFGPLSSHCTRFFRAQMRGDAAVADAQSNIQGAGAAA